MTTIVWSLIYLLPFLAPATDIVMITPAYDVATGRLLYNEERKQFDINGKPGEWVFTYRDRSGGVIVNRKVNFKKNVYIPDYSLQDVRDGYLEGSEWKNGKVRVYARRTSADPVKEKWLTVPEPAVVDAGFNFYIESNWKKLMDGETLHFNFIAPIEQDYFKFRLLKNKEWTENGRSLVQFKLEIDNFLLRIFVKPILVTYNQATKQLAFYEGISNINDDKGKSHRVKMIFK